MKKYIVWFQRDLRLRNNPALLKAAESGIVLPIYIIDSAENVGSASKWWLENSLKLLDRDLNDCLSIFIGNSFSIIKRLIQKESVAGVYWNDVYEPDILNRNQTIKNWLISKNILVQTFNASLLWMPWESCKSDGSPYKVFTPFMKNLVSGVLKPSNPKPKPTHLLVNKVIFSSSIDQLCLLEKNTWSDKFGCYWKPGEKSALRQLKKFLNGSIDLYETDRDYPGKRATSRLSPYLHFGELSPNQIWFSVKKSIDNKAGNAFLRQLIWREFSYHLLYHFPDFAVENWREKFNDFPWQSNKKLFNAWKSGLTGYPIIDAGMRELWETGYMHNRVRMLVASFLVKNCLIDWRLGAEHFFDCLLDADLANNSVSWQWVAGSGADAAPFFRIFNPILQAKKFDPEGKYIRKFVPEIAGLSNRYLYAPWEAPDSVLSSAGIKLGKTYPKPIVNLQFSRQRALKFYQKLK